MLLDHQLVVEQGASLFVSVLAIESNALRPLASGDGVARVRRFSTRYRVECSEAARPSCSGEKYDQFQYSLSSRML